MPKSMPSTSSVRNASARTSSFLGLSTSWAATRSTASVVPHDVEGSSGSSSVIVWNTGLPREREGVDRVLLPLYELLDDRLPVRGGRSARARLHPGRVVDPEGHRPSRASTGLTTRGSRSRSRVPGSRSAQMRRDRAQGIPRRGAGPFMRALSRSSSSSRPTSRGYQPLPTLAQVHSRLLRVNKRWTGPWRFEELAHGPGHGLWLSSPRDRSDSTGELRRARPLERLQRMG